jgi:phosphonate transport system ATP-binding protein
MDLLQVSALTKYYTKDARALSDVNFSLSEGEFTAVIGPSGSGKTTLIRCINRLIEPTSGQIIFCDEDISNVSTSKLRHIRSSMGMIFQHYNLVERLSVIENVLHGRLGYKNSLEGIFGIYSEEEKLNALRILELLGLEDYVYRRADCLSGGQKQRVGIARALVQNPKIILCDEPISSLDPSSAKIIMDYLRKVQEEYGITILVNLHQVNIAKKYAQRILGFNKGELVFDGAPHELTDDRIHMIYGTEAGELIHN